MSSPNLKSKPSFIFARNPSIDRANRPKPEKQIKLSNLIAEEETDEYDDSGDDIDSASSIGSLGTCNSNSNLVEGALIYLRMRPIKQSEKICDNYIISNNILITKAQLNDDTKNVTEKHFTFTDIFSSSVKQNEIYEKCIKKKIEDEESFTVMAYGTSGSGKTFTLLGDIENPGMILRSLENIFKLYENNINCSPIFRIRNGNISFEDDQLAQKSLFESKLLLDSCIDSRNIHGNIKSKIEYENQFNTKNINGQSVFIWISFVEIYNETVSDLLILDNIDSHKRKPLKILLNDGKVFIKNLTTIFVKNSHEAYKLLTYGLKRVTYASTAINTNSSRSHCIFFVDVITFNKPDLLAHRSYKFCDLAGSERLDKTGNVGNRLKEAQRINTSLMVLGRCLLAASHNQQIKNKREMIPYRESKLTMLLQASLLGKEKISMIVNLSPIQKYYEENLNVLSFSSIAKDVFFKPLEQKPKKSRFSWFANTLTGNNNIGNDEKFDTLFEENTTLRSEIERLNDIIVDLQNELSSQEKAIRKEVAEIAEENRQRTSKLWEEHMIAQKVCFEKKYNSMKEFYVRKLKERDAEDEDDDDKEQEDENVTEQEEDDVEILENEQNENL